MAEAYGTTAIRSLQDSAALRAWETTVLAHLSSTRETPGAPLSLAHAAALFIEDMLHAGYHLTTARRWWYYFKIFLEWCTRQGVEHLAQVEPEVVRRFLGHLRWERKLGRHSLHSYFAKLFFFLRHFTERGVLPSHPMQGMRIRQGTSKPAQRLLSEVEIRSLFRERSATTSARCLSTCPARALCAKAKTGRRTITRDDQEPLREAMRLKM